FLAGGYNIFQGTWLGSAGPSAVELVVLDWFRQWLDMPATAGGLFMSGGSAANLTAIACARLDRFGAHDGRAVIYLTEECHSSIERAARILGFDHGQLRVVATDDQDRMRLDALSAAVEADAAARRTPFLVVANAGSTSTGTVDPLPELRAYCRDRGLWLHVDAAYGGFAVLTERGRAKLAGIGEADSITLDPHKLLYQPFEAGCLLVRDTALLERAFQVLPGYLQDAAVNGNGGADLPRAASGDGVNFGDRGLQLTRSARALKVWVSVQYFGVDRFRAAIDRTMTLAEHAERTIRALPAFELVTPASFGIVCFRRRIGGDDAATERANAELVKLLADSGEGLISSTRRQGRYALRLCILSHRTREFDVDHVLNWLEHAPVEDQRETSR
ncbi:MAG: pyridoxal phosphate-dependent decarboxylase family protein, partial [Longimicrobiales bacterium]